MTTSLCGSCQREHSPSLLGTPVTFTAFTHTYDGAEPDGTVTSTSANATFVHGATALHPRSSTAVQTDDDQRQVKQVSAMLRRVTDRRDAHRWTPPRYRSISRM